MPNENTFYMLLNCIFSQCIKKIKMHTFQWQGVDRMCEFIETNNSQSNWFN